MVVCGYDIRGTVTELSPNGERKTRKIQPRETIWNKFEEIFHSNFRLINDKDYIKFLQKCQKGNYESQWNENFIRRWTLPLTQYGKHYDFCDVCLAPIQEEEYIKDNKGTIRKRVHIFNEVKSELKIIEAGMRKKTLIAQDFGIYRKLLKDGETGLLVSDNKKGWYKAMYKVIMDKDFREELATNLHNFVKDKYELKEVTRNRVNLYKELMKKK